MKGPGRWPGSTEKDRPVDQGEFCKNGLPKPILEGVTFGLSHKGYTGFQRLKKRGKVILGL